MMKVSRKRNKMIVPTTIKTQGRKILVFLS